MTDKKPIRFAFNSHGLGDVVHACHAMRLYVDRGYDVAIQVEENKRWIWEAARIPIYDGPEELPLHPYYYPNDFFALGHPDHTHNKAAHFFEISELPKLGTKLDVWEALCSVKIDPMLHIEWKAHAEAKTFLSGLPSPIFVLHSKGTNWQSEKSIPDGIAFELIFKLLETGGSVVILDYDARVPVVTGHPRVRSIKAVGGGGWGHIGCDRLCALIQRADLFIGVDSGPFHVASLMTDTPCLGVFRKIPPVRCCLPSPNARYLVPAKDHEHWIARGPEWTFVEYPMEEVSATDIAVAAINIVYQDRGQTMNEINGYSVPGQYVYRRIGYDERPMELLPDGKIGEGAAGCERVWKIEQTPTHPVLTIYGEHGGPTCHLERCPDGVFRGHWLDHERMPIELWTLVSEPLGNTEEFADIVDDVADDQPAKLGHPSDALPDYPETFYVGIPTLFCRDLLHKCIESILAGSALPRAIYVVDNSDGTRMEPWIPHPSKRIRVIRPNANIGVARSWNLLHSLTQPAPLIITNDDVEIGHNLFEKMLACPESWVSGSGNQMCCVFLLRNKLWQEIGRFDETFWPAYHEDNDYGYRMKLAGYSPFCPQSDGYKDNGPSATKAMFNEGELNHFHNCFFAGRQYYVRKWGGAPHLETFTVPFNGDPNGE